MKNVAHYKADAEKTAHRHQKLQAEVAKADSNKKSKKQAKAMQAGARKYPAPPA